MRADDQLIRIDFGPTSGETASGWNNASADGNGSGPWVSKFGNLPAVIIANLNDSEGNPTGISLIQQSTSSSGNHGVGGATLSGTPLDISATETGHPVSALQDLVYVSSNTSVTYWISELDPTTMCQLTFFAGLNLQRQKDSTQFSVSGATSQPPVTFSPTNNSLTQTIEITPDSQGRITIIFSGQGDTAHWNLLEIRLTRTPTLGTAVTLTGSTAQE